MTKKRDGSNLFKGWDINNQEVEFLESLDQGFKERQLEYRDPSKLPYGNPELWTTTQKEVWPHLIARGEENDVGLLVGNRVGLIGAKGSGKTKLGSYFALHQCQMFPFSIGFICSNTLGQVKDSAVPHLAGSAKEMGIDIEFFKTRKVHSLNQPLQDVYVVRLGGGVESYICLRTFENISAIEGSEWDWQWFEEIQDAKKEDFVVARSRCRGTGANRACFVASMPEDEFHWQYTMLPKTKFMVRQPSLLDNLHNVGDDYLEDLVALYEDKELLARYVYGLPSSINSNKVFYKYSHKYNRTNPLAKMLCKYDESLEIVLSLDFNVSPMCASIWQKKKFTGQDVQDFLIIKEQTNISKDALAKLGLDVGVANTVDKDDVFEAICQIDELEVWEGGTRKVMEEFAKKYRNHLNGFQILGDASGNHRDTRNPSLTDYVIVSQNMSGFRNVKIKRGLIATHKSKGNKREDRSKYSNPNIKDTINKVNGLMLPLDGVPRIFFLEESKYSSGGLARSVASYNWKPDGQLDQENDRSPDRTKSRSHFSDTARYVAWWFKGGLDSSTKKRAKEVAKKMRSGIKLGLRTDFRM